MNEHLYHIHDLITVRLDPRVHSWVLKSVHQQIGAFRSEKERATSFVIRIMPFARFSVGPEREIFQGAKGGRDSWYADGEARQAVQKTQNGYDVYTDVMISLLGLIQQLFLRKSISFAHAAALKDPQGNVIVLAGAGGVGKTALAGFLVKEKGYTLLGDDMVALGESGTCLAFHRPLVLKEYHRLVYPEAFAKLKHKSWQRRAVRFLVWQLYANAPFRGVLDGLLKRWGLYDRITFIPFIRPDYVDIVSVSEIFGAEHLALQGPIAKTVFLVRSYGSDFSLQERDAGWMARRMFAVLYQELASELEQLLKMGALGLEDLGADFWRVRTILEKAVSGTPCSLLRIPEEATPEDLIRAFDRLVLSK